MSSWDTDNTDQNRCCDIRSWHCRVGVAVSCPVALQVKVVVPPSDVAPVWHLTVHDWPPARMPVVMSVHVSTTTYDEL
jgi:hypothetical protein